MEEFNILFGYLADGGTSVLLHRDGTLICQTGRPNRPGDRCVHYRLTKACLTEIQTLIENARGMLTSCAEEINRGQNLTGENLFIFDDIRIADWDLDRVFVEEDRQKHPEYYRNSVRVHLTQTHVRAVFDEICALIEADEKALSYSRMLLKPEGR